MCSSDLDLAALARIREKQEILANRIIREFEGSEIQVLNGRYGPYITDGAKNGKIPKDREPSSLSLAECQEILANAPDKPARGRFGAKKAPAKKAAAKKSVSKAAGDKPPAKKAAAKKSASKKTAVKKAPAKKAAAKKSASKAVAKEASA